MRNPICFHLTLAGALVLISGYALAQDQLSSMPRYDRYEKLRREIAGSVQRGDARVRWIDGGDSLAYDRDGKSVKFDPKTGKFEDIEKLPTAAGPAPGGRGGRRGGAADSDGVGRRMGPNPARGRQYIQVGSLDGKWRASYKDQNVWLSDASGGNPVQITLDGNAEKRVKYGNASWTYGEELSVRDAMWWSPDSKKLAFYRFDESKVPDYYLATSITSVQDTLYVEPYVKAGAPNPDVQIFIYDLDSKKTVKVDAAFDSGGGPDISHYLYDVRWSGDSKELYFNRTNRKQNVMEWCAADGESGKCRTIIRESSSTGWVENSPQIMWLEAPSDPKTPRKFLWFSERNGFRNAYLYDTTGKLFNAVTKGSFEVASIVNVDEATGVVWYLGRDGETPYRAQLHRVKLDGSGDVRLTDPKFHHSVQIAPNGKYFVDTMETYDAAPTSVLRDATGKSIVSLATSNLTKFNELGLKKTEMVEYTAADGVTKLYGRLQKPSDFDPTKKYPVIVTVYAGPDSGGGFETFQTPNPMTELGFLVASFDGRGTSGRGIEFRHMAYKKLGIVEIDDQAAGVKALDAFPYVDSANVGITGTSYGGFSSTMCLLRYPNLFRAAVASSSVTDWRNYDSIYTERYMDTPQNNPEGYDAGSAMKYARDLKGKLMLFYGTADDNVHPANTYQLAQALQRAGKSFDMMVGPDMGHSGLNMARTLEYFIEHLVLRPGKQPLELAWKQHLKSRKARIAANKS